jgi:hypothetical protein
MRYNLNRQNLVKIKPFKTTLMHELKQSNLGSGVNSLQFLTVTNTIPWSSFPAEFDYNYIAMLNHKALHIFTQYEIPLHVSKHNPLTPNHL